jgi:hypothetical protein
VELSSEISPANATSRARKGRRDNLFFHKDYYRVFLIKGEKHYSACRAHTLLKQLTQQTPITIDGLPAFVPVSRWVIDPHDDWVSN